VSHISRSRAAVRTAAVVPPPTACMNGLPILSQFHVPPIQWAQQDVPKQSSLLEKFQCRIVFFKEVHKEHSGGHAFSSYGLRPNGADSSWSSLKQLQTLMPYFAITNLYNRFSNAKLSTPRFQLIEITRVVFCVH